MTKKYNNPIILNLNTYSYYSLLSSTLSIDEIILFAKNNNQKFVSLTDTNLYGAVEFYNKAIENDLLPVLGLHISYKSYELVLFIQNNIGYHNLIKISSFLKLDKEFDLNDFLDGIFILNKSDKVIDFLNCPIFSFNQNHDNRIACNEARYLCKEDNVILSIIKRIQTNAPIADVAELEEYHNLYLLDYDSFSKKFDSIAIENLNSIIQDINWKLEPITDNIYSSPSFSSKIELAIYLKDKCVESLNNKILLGIVKTDLKEKYLNRIEYELKIINEMGFNDYFLIVSDFVQECRNNDILVGPGRGSSAGSLVAYLLGITQIDSIKYNLIFERFLNPGRVSMPDIDIDVMDIKREKIIEYIFNKYGYEHVAHIVTFQKIKAKMAIRDVGRILNVDLKVINKICKLIPMEYENNLDDAISNGSELKSYADEFSDLFKISKKIMGLPRQNGIHAAGIILSKNKLIDVIPIQTGTNNCIVTQYSMEYLEQLGLLKIDILGLTNLTTIYNVLKLIKLVYKVDVDLEKISLNDKKVFDEISKANTMGIFQLESPGMRNLLKKIKPQNIEDISLCSALFRPGPQQNIKSFVNRRNKLETVEFIDYRSKDILLPTHGILIYQEQVIELVKNVANFSLIDADIFRRIISKKHESELIEFKAKFIDSAIKNGYSEKHISDIYNYIYNFANYGFVHSHSIAYSLIGYWMSFLKTHYPSEFMITLMASFNGNRTKIDEYVYECNRLDINILPPSINLSLKTFSLYKRKILFGFNCIKGIGEEISKKIISIRDSLPEKAFSTFPIAIKHLVANGIGEATIEVLILANAFDVFKMSKKYLLTNLKEYIATSKNIKSDGEYLFSPNLKDVIETEEDDSHYADREQELLGVRFHSNINVSRFDKIDEALIRKHNVIDISEAILSNSNCNVMASIISIKKIKTKTNKNMAFIKIFDKTDKLDIVCFIDKFLEDDFLNKNKIYIFSLKFSTKNHQLVGVIEVKQNEK
ncbi:MAG: DNA polymerase III subunit alpha [Malacoplasma sp.]